MYASTIEKYCSEDEEIRKSFRGVFARDEFFKQNLIVPPLSEAVSFVVNTGNRGKARKGEDKHWLAIYVEAPKGPVLIFDSFGYRPKVYGPYFDLWVKSLLPMQVIGNKKVVQDLASPRCGLYVMMALYCLCRKERFSKLMRRFSIDKPSNEQLVTRFSSNAFKIKKPDQLIKKAKLGVDAAAHSVLLLTRKYV